MVLTLLADMRWRIDRLQRLQAGAGSGADAEMNSLISGGGGGGGEKTRRIDSVIILPVVWQCRRMAHDS